jgi:O-antigen ligase
VTIVVDPPSGPTRLRFVPRPSAAAKRRMKYAAAFFGLLLWTLSGALGGMKGAVTACVISVGVTAVLLVRPGISSWLQDPAPTGDVPPHRRGSFLTDLADRATATPAREMGTALVLLGVGVAVSVGAASIGEKAIVILVGLIALLGLVSFIKNRTLFFMFVFAASFSLILYKKFTPFLGESYAVAIYITTINVVLLFLYFIWVAEGTMIRDLREGLRDPVFMLPFAAMGLILITGLGVDDQRLVWAEMVRYMWATALFIYVGVRVRRREHIWAFMLGWLVFLAVQVIVSTSQKYTGSFLGIEMFAISLDPSDPESGRPAGTQIHPVFLGCVVGMVCSLVACFALHVKQSWTRYLLLSCIPLAFVPSFLARARGPFMALIPTVAFILVFAVRRKLLSMRAVIIICLLGLIGLGVMFPKVQATADAWFGGGSRLHGVQSTAKENWDERMKLNWVAYRMVRENPMFGVGINTFEQTIDEYKYEEIAFDIRPAHNLFILMAAETGLVGLGVTISIGLVFAWYSYRLTRSRDPMFVGLGIGALAMLVFVIIEELNSFTLKQDVPMTMFWTVFGLVVAANRMADQGCPPLPTFSWVRRSGLGSGPDSDADATPEPVLAGADR